MELAGLLNTLCTAFVASYSTTIFDIDSTISQHETSRSIWKRDRRLYGLQDKPPVVPGYFKPHVYPR